jgi:hypothetical protein
MSESVAPSPIKSFCKVWTECFSRLLGSFGVVSLVASSSDPISTQALTPQELENLVRLLFSGGGAIKSASRKGNCAGSISVTQFAPQSRKTPQGDTLCAITSRYFVDTSRPHPHYGRTPFQIYRPVSADAHSCR